MNKWDGIGRTTKDIELRYSQDNKAVARFTLAVNRRSKDDGADFISCVAFGKTAELLGQYVNKGDRIGVSGRIQTGSYTNKDGNKVYTTDVIIDELEFLENKREGTQENNSFIDVPEDAKDDLPFV